MKKQVTISGGSCLGKSTLVQILRGAGYSSARVDAEDLMGEEYTIDEMQKFLLDRALDLWLRLPQEKSHVWDRHVYDTLAYWRWYAQTGEGSEKELEKAIYEHTEKLANIPLVPSLNIVLLMPDKDTYLAAYKETKGRLPMSENLYEREKAVEASILKDFKRTSANFKTYAWEDFSKRNEKVIDDVIKYLS